MLCFRMALVPFLILVFFVRCKNRILGSLPNPLDPGDLEGAKNPKPETTQKSAATTETTEPDTTDLSSLFRFDFPEPAQSAVSRTLKLWGTFYHFPSFKLTETGSFSIRNMKEETLFTGLSKKEWCDAALQGSFALERANLPRTVFSFAGRSVKNLVDCSATISKPVAEKIKGNRFEVVTAPFGRGGFAKQVIPHRTWAVDKRTVPNGSILFVKAARGKMVTLPDGKSVAHDGYFFAGDAGSAIIGNHVDFFVGPINKQPFDFVKSSASFTFEVKIVKMPEVETYFKKIHGL